MKFLSVCSGIEAASCAWHPLGWKAVAFSEIEPFPSAVLAARWADVPNLGDMTKFKDWPALPHLDIVVGGTPCQSFSVAGLRRGMLDPRGNLTLTFLAIVDKYRPKFVLWENVPGVLSDRTGGMDAMLDGFEELGYVIDVDILDAQFHGVPQRRRRVFICAQSVETLLSEKTPSSVLTMAQCLSEILHGLLIAFLSQSESGHASSASPILSKDGVRRRMKLFGLQKVENLEMLRASLDDAIQRSARERSLSESGGAPGMDSSETTGEPLPDSPRMLTEKLCASWSTGTLWQHIKGALSLAGKWSTTSTATTAITPLEIFTFSQAALNIGRLIALSNEQSPCFWSAASSNLTAVQAYIDYARHTSSDLFGDAQRVCAWHDFLRQAEPANDALGDTGIRNFGAILPLSHSLQGHSAPSRQAGQGATRDLAPCIGASGRGFDRGDTRGQDAVVACLDASYGRLQGASGQDANHG